MALKSSHLPFVALALVLVITPAAAMAGGPALRVDARAGRHPISPYIYGQNFTGFGTTGSLNPNNWTLAKGMAFARRVGQTVDRWGGNSTDRYNWQVGAWNAGSDYYFENVADCLQWNECDNWRSDARSYQRFVENDRKIGARSLITLPLAGWVAKDARTDHPFSCSYPKTQFPAQDDFDSNDKGQAAACGIGRYRCVPDETSGQVSPDCTKYTADPSTANVEADPRSQPEFFTGWVKDLVKRYGTAAQNGVLFYELGNEPGLWSDTHRDVHPQGTSYDELWAKSLSAAVAVKAVDPAANTLGFSEWGWPNYFCSQADIDGAGIDQCKSSGATAPDSQAHGGKPIVEWLLEQFRRASEKAGVRLLDYIDVHYYNQANPYDLKPLNPQGKGRVSDTTRSLWDRGYTDPSWISDQIALLPRMKEWVADNYPGTKLALSEYNLSLANVGPLANALMQADALGIFAREGLDLATRWTQDVDGEWKNNHYVDLIPWAFRIYRDYDGKRSRFGDTSVSATSSAQDALAVYAASRSSDGALTIVVINKTKRALSSRMTLVGAHARRAYVYRWSGGQKIQRLSDERVAGTGFTAAYPGQSVTIFQLGGKRPA